jgi:sialate O-acetylesterase
MIRLPSVFSDGAVLSKEAKVWGWAEPRQFVMASFLEKNYETITDDAGRFEFTFMSENFGGPFDLVIEDTTISVYIGRVWFCGGQSNMEGPISRTRMSLGEYVIDDPRIRIFQAEKGHKFDGPAQDVGGKWNTATGDFLDNMYAVPYFFARNLLASLPEDDVPIGLVCTPSGGTSLEGWLPEEIVKNHPEIHEKLPPLKAPGFIERVTEEAEGNVQAWYKDLHERDRGISENWRSPDFDDSDWEQCVLLDTTYLPKYGSVWYRKKFKLPKIAGEALLNLGRFENSVTVYINGKEVVNIGYSYPPCRCKISEGVLVEGENTIAIRVVGGGDTIKVIPGKEYALLFDGQRVNFLDGKWRRNVGAEKEKCPPGAWFYSHPCGVYNFMLAPLLGYSVDGFLWYQGESNTGHPHNYKMLFTEFVTHIRKFFGKQMPVLFTQVANCVDPYSYGMVGGFGAPGGYWAILREQQRQCLQIPNTAMAVTIDCGEWNDLHPTDKKTVGDRLALHARRMVYDEDIVSCGPAVDRVEFDPRDEKLTVHFLNKEGLWAKGGHPLLYVMDKDQSVHSVYATLRNETLEAICGGLIPVVVRFAWADCPSVPVYNAYGLPASPFEEVIGGAKKQSRYI